MRDWVDATRARCHTVTGSGHTHSTLSTHTRTLRAGIRETDEWESSMTYGRNGTWIEDVGVAAVGMQKRAGRALGTVEVGEPVSRRKLEQYEKQRKLKKGTVFHSIRCCHQEQNRVAPPVFDLRVLGPTMPAPPPVAAMAMHRWAAIFEPSPVCVTDIFIDQWNHSGRVVYHDLGHTHVVGKPKTRSVPFQLLRL